MTKDMMLKALSDFCSKHGKEIDLAEYKSFGSNVPVKDYLLRREFGNWTRVLNFMKKRYPISVAPAKVEKPKAAPKKAAPKKAAVKVEKEDVKN